MTFICRKLPYKNHPYKKDNVVEALENGFSNGNMFCDHAQFDEYGYCDKCFKEV